MMELVVIPEVKSSVRRGRVDSTSASRTEKYGDWAGLVILRLFEEQDNAVRFSEFPLGE